MVLVVGAGLLSIRVSSRGSVGVFEVFWEGGIWGAGVSRSGLWGSVIWGVGLGGAVICEAGL